MIRASVIATASRFEFGKLVTFAEIGRKLRLLFLWWALQAVFPWAGISLPTACFAEMPGKIRPAAVAGQFYPSDSEELKQTVVGLISQVQSTASCPADARVVVLVVPHAGYMYSGATAAAGFKTLLNQSFDRICFLGVDHRSGRPTISVWSEGGFSTPLGTVPIAATFSRELLNSGPMIVDDPSQHLQEHSLEVLLPFFITAFGKREAAFVSVGGQPENGISLGDILYKLVSNTTDRYLFIVSTDWSHEHDAKTAEKLDKAGIEGVLALNEERILEDCQSGKTELCGLNGVLAATRLMRLLKGRAVLLEQSDSSRGSGDFSRVVGYASILLTAGTALSVSNSKEPIVNTPIQIFHSEALRAVRTTLEGYLKDRQLPKITVSSPRFQEVCGVFVTLKKHGELRGCIGLIQGVKPLAQGIQEMAVAAATEDPRFPAVTVSELAEIDIEISVLSPMTPVKEVGEIQVGRDGLLLRRGFHSGLFLPQVPTEQGWDRETFLEHLCYKAGLPKGSHTGGDAQLLRFSAEVFGEKE